MITNIGSGLKKLLGMQVEIEYKNSMGNLVQRKGRLEYEDGWYYLYDEGKKGADFNIAISQNDSKNIISIEYYPLKKQP